MAPFFRPTRRPALRAALALLASSALAACGDDPVDPTEAIQGTWELVELNGEGLPVSVFQSSSEEVFITGGSLTLRAGQSHTAVTIAEQWVGGELEQESEFSVNGSYSVSGDSITLVEGNSVLRGTFTDELISVTGFEQGFGNVTWTYQR